MRLFSDIIANQIIPKALSPELLFFFFFLGRRGAGNGGSGWCSNVCAWMGGGDEASVCVCVFVWMHVCVHSSGRAVFSNLYTAAQETVVFRWLHSSALSAPTKYIYTPIHMYPVIFMHTSHRNQHSTSRLPLQTPSLVVSSHFNLKGSSTSPSR